MAKSMRSTMGRRKTPASKTSGSKTPASKTPASKAKPSPKAASAAPEDDDFDELAAINELEAEVEALEAAAEAAAHAAAAAKSAYLARHSNARMGSTAEAEPIRNPKPTARSGQSLGQGSGQGSGQSGDYLDMLTRAFDNLSSNQWNPETLNEMTSGVGMVLGSGPAFATLGSMLANSTAQGSILMNATQMQRQLDQVGLCCTSACVKQLLSLNDGYDPE